MRIAEIGPLGRRLFLTRRVLSNSALSFAVKQTTCLLSVAEVKDFFTVRKKPRAIGKEDVPGRNSIQKWDLLRARQNIHTTGEFPRDN